MGKVSFSSPFALWDGAREMGKKRSGSTHFRRDWGGSMKKGRSEKSRLARLRQAQLYNCTIVHEIISAESMLIIVIIY